MMDPLYSMSVSVDRLALHLKWVTARRLGATLALWSEAVIEKTYTVRKLLRELPYRTFSLHATLPVGEWVKVLRRSVGLPRWATGLCARLESAEYLGNDEVTQALGARLGVLSMAELLHDLGAHKCHSRPSVSNNNSYRKAQFKTLKYRPDYPQHFAFI